MNECQTIAVMNTKGGVGKSTTVMALAETLSTFHNRNVLVIDSDSQTSISIMLMHIQRWEQAEDADLTLTNLLTRLTLVGQEADWQKFIISDVSDVDEAGSIYLLPSNMELSLFERAVSEAHKHADLRMTIRTLLTEIKEYFDIVLVDCPPGISILTETWMRECDYILPPTKPDYLAVRGLGIMQRFKNANTPDDFATHLGVVVNQKDTSSPNDDLWHQGLMADARNRCFATAIPRRAYIQNAADFKLQSRSYIAKYPGDAGQAIKTLTREVLARMDALGDTDASTSQAEQMAATQSIAPQTSAAPPRTIRTQTRSAAAPPTPAARPSQPDEPVDLSLSLKIPNR